MKKHVKNYLKYHNLIKDCWIACEQCGGTAVDIHHKMKRSQQGSDDPSNLIGLCRACHEKYHK